MKKIDIATDHELLAAILQFQLLTFECLVKWFFPYGEMKTETLDCIVKYRKEMFEDEIHVD